MKKILFVMAISALFPFINARYVAVFAHGLAATKNQARLFLKEYKKSNHTVIHNPNYIMDMPYVSFDFPDSTHFIDPSVWFQSLRQLIASFIRGNYDYTSFGQENEIDILHKVFIEKITQDQKAIFCGISRGASIFFTWQKIYPLPNIAGAVLESPYGAMVDVVNLKRKQFGVELFISENMGQTIIEFMFRKYKRAGIAPIDCVQCVGQKIPILIIASTSDYLVPWESSFALYQALRDAGHEKVHFLLLDQGEHGFLLSGPEGKKYQQVVHAFYNHYGLPCDEELAIAGKEMFDKII